MTPGNWPLTIIQGQSKKVSITWNGKDLTGCTVRYYGKNSPADASPDYLLTDTNGGITWLTRSPGKFQINYTPTVTANIAEGSSYHFLWVDFANGDSFPLLSGPVQCSKG
jgi:hypothetical protein